MKIGCEKYKKEREREMRMKAVVVLNFKPVKKLTLITFLPKTA